MKRAVQEIVYIEKKPTKNRKQTDKRRRNVDKSSGKKMWQLLLQK